MMLVRSTILMPSSAPGISLSVRDRTRLPLPRRGVTGSATATQNAGGSDGRARPDAQRRERRCTSEGAAAASGLAMDFLHWASILRTADVDPDQPIDLEDCSSHDQGTHRVHLHGADPLA